MWPRRGCAHWRESRNPATRARTLIRHRPVRSIAVGMGARTSEACGARPNSRPILRTDRRLGQGANCRAGRSASVTLGPWRWRRYPQTDASLQDGWPLGAHRAMGLLRFESSRTERGERCRSLAYWLRWAVFWRSPTAHTTRALDLETSNSRVSQAANIPDFPMLHEPSVTSHIKLELLGRRDGLRDADHALSLQARALSETSPSFVHSVPAGWNHDAAKRWDPTWSRAAPTCARRTGPRSV